ncbi:nose resistant to fluoxetine protein 6-like [Colletes gigas]|uniref:nose resistant to fluoxetine protein 6-like n=1 Tax=Colletes gigas TaxID=935657 RepID=UPI001C9B3266|nr:nose resistant to fluoxetine protein 6-like [Colletes gigas]
MVWKKIVPLVAFCASIHAIDPNRATMRETIPLYAIIGNVDLINETRCQRELLDVDRAIENQIMWGMKILDSNGVPGTGYISGNNYWLGDRLECNRINDRNVPQLKWSLLDNGTRYNDISYEVPPFTVNFYVVQIHEESYMQDIVLQETAEKVISLGLCLPSSCTEDQLTTMIEKVLQDRTLLFPRIYNVEFDLIKVIDYKKYDQWSADGLTIVIILVLASSVGMVVAGTYYDLTVHQDYLEKKKKFVPYENNNITVPKKDTEKKPEPTKSEKPVPPLVEDESLAGRILLCFSAYTNIKEIFRLNPQPGTLNMLHGMKVIGVVWILIVHVLIYGAFSVGNKMTAFLLSTILITQPFSNASYSVDTFFFVSGFLLTHLFVKTRQVKQMPQSETVGVRLFNFFMILIRRIIRLTPAYGITILVAILTFSWLEKNSLIYMYERAHERCIANWWKNLLYINTFYSWNELCLTWSWYLSDDTQFFIFGTLLLLISITHFNFALTAGIVTFIASIVATGYVAYTIDYVPLIDIQFQTLSLLYIPPLLRIGPFLIGMATAHLLAKWDYKLELSNKAFAIGWTIGTMCNVTVLYGLIDRNLPIFLSVAYAALSRVIWAFGIAWLVVACATNNGGIINKVLSHPIWLPLSRMSYSIYLLNPLLIYTVYLSTSYPLFHDPVTTAAIFLGISLATFIFGLMLSLIAELPAILLLQMMFAPKQTK